MAETRLHWEQNLLGSAQPLGTSPPLQFYSLLLIFGGWCGHCWAIKAGAAAVMETPAAWSCGANWSDSAALAVIYKCDGRQLCSVGLDSAA